MMATISPISFKGRFGSWVRLLAVCCLTAVGDIPAKAQTPLVDRTTSDDAEEWQLAIAPIRAALRHALSWDLISRDEYDALMPPLRTVSGGVEVGEVDQELVRAVLEVLDSRVRGVVAFLQGNASRLGPENNYMYERAASLCGSVSNVLVEHFGEGLAALEDGRVPIPSPEANEGALGAVRSSGACFAQIQLMLVDFNHSRRELRDQLQPLLRDRETKERECEALQGEALASCLGELNDLNEAILDITEKLPPNPPAVSDGSRDDCDGGLLKAIRCFFKGAAGVAGAVGRGVIGVYTWPVGVVGSGGLRDNWEKVVGLNDEPEPGTVHDLGSDETWRPIVNEYREDIRDDVVRPLEGAGWERVRYSPPPGGNQGVKVNMLRNRGQVRLYFGSKRVATFCIRPSAGCEANLEAMQGGSLEDLEDFSGVEFQGTIFAGESFMSASGAVNYNRLRLTGDLQGRRFTITERVPVGSGEYSVTFEN